MFFWTGASTSYYDGWKNYQFLIKEEKKGVFYNKMVPVQKKAKKGPIDSQ